MAGETTFQSISDYVRQSIGSFTKDRTWFENAAPGYTAFKKFVEKVPFTEKGFQLPYISRRPGGHTSWIPSSSDFNAAVAPASQSMYVYPTGYALPMIFTGTLIAGLEKGETVAKMKFDSFLQLYIDSAMKRLEYFIYGDGSGALAFSSSTLGSTGSGQTMNCTTAAAATAGQTKGAMRLEEGHTYQAINTSTGAVRGTILVETEGTTSCVVNVTSGTVSSGDPLVDPNGYNRAMRGLAHLVSKTSRVLQALNTANFRDLNSPEVDLNGVLCTPADYDQAKTMLQTRNNSETAENQLINFLTFGFYSTLKRQGWNLTIQDKTQTTGVAKKFVDGDTVFIRTSDMDEDRSYFVHPEAMKMFEEREFGEMNLDNQSLRMLLGANNTGSDNYQKALGCRSNPGIVLPRGCAYIKRALITGQATQTGSF